MSLSLNRAMPAWFDLAQMRVLSGHGAATRKKPIAFGTECNGLSLATGSAFHAHHLLQGVHHLHQVLLCSHHRIDVFVGRARGPTGTLCHTMASSSRQRLSCCNTRRSPVLQRLSIWVRPWGNWAMGQVVRERVCCEHSEAGHRLLTLFASHACLCTGWACRVKGPPTASPCEVCLCNPMT
jgi:hypothetical protein